MSLTSYIENLKLASEEKRRRVAFLSAGALTLLIFFVWLSVTRLTMSVPPAESQVATPAMAIGEDQSTLGEAKDRLIRGWSKLKEAF